MFARLFVLIAVLFVSATAFKPTSIGRVATSRAALRMSPVDMAIEASNVLSGFSQVLAEEGDFGGYAGPAGSLIFIGILILSLAPPLKAKEE